MDPNALTNVLANVIAIVIPAFAVYLIFALDLYGTGKGSTVFICLGWGAAMVFVAATISNNFLLYHINSEDLPRLAAPIVEELLKAVVLLFFVTRPRFRYIVDGAVYGFAAGIGFAIFENLFVYIPQAYETNAALTFAVSRVLSSTLMHATACAMVGVSLGRLRRSSSNFRWLWAIGGIIIAITLHSFFNNVARPEVLPGATVLIVGIAIGIGGSAVIGFLISQGLKEEKKRFQQTLGLSIGVSKNERRAVQELGGNKAEEVLKEMSAFFGEEKIEKIRRLLVVQANMGILQNNLNTPVSENLRRAWEKEIRDLHTESDQIRNDLGMYVMGFLRNIFPTEDTQTSNTFALEIKESDPHTIHGFDLFLMTAEKTGTIPVDQLLKLAGSLKKVEIFKEVDLTDLENLSRAATSRSYTNGQVIFEEGQPGDSLYVIQQGGIDIYAKDKKAGEVLLRHCNVGDVVGEIALLDGFPRSARAVASGDLKTMMLKRDHFMTFLSSRPMVMLAILQFLINRVRITTQIIETSVSWVTNIAQGNYEKAAALQLSNNTGGIAALPLPGGKAVANVDAASDPHISVEEHLESASSAIAAQTETGVTAETPVVLAGIFSKVTNTLEKRELDLRMKTLGAETTALDLSEISENWRRVMTILLNQPLPDGYTFEGLMDKLPHENLKETLADLDHDGWLLISGEGAHMRYKANPKRRKTTRVFDPFKAANLKKPTQNISDTGTRPN